MQLLALDSAYRSERFQSQTRRLLRGVARVESTAGIGPVHSLDLATCYGLKYIVSTASYPETPKKRLNRGPSLQPEVFHLPSTAGGRLRDRWRAVRHRPELRWMGTMRRLRLAAIYRYP